MKRDLKFEDLPNAVSLVLDKVENLEKELSNIKENFSPKEQVELLTRKETAEFFRVSLVTLYNWTKYGILVSYRIGTRVYYKRSEIILIMYSSK